MKDKFVEVVEKHGKKVYHNITKKGWAIVIMPDNILIDNFHHGYPHIHPDRKEIKLNDSNIVLEEVLKHLNKNKGMDYMQLRKELIK
jgi:Fe-S cluster biosynthesis and repair protein YggX